jgi:hypothetical protein
MMAPVWWMNMSRRMRVMLLLLGGFVAVMLANALFGSLWVDFYHGNVWHKPIRVDFLRSWPEPKGDAPHHPLSHVPPLKPLVTFVTPTVGRATLARTIWSLHRQNDANWLLYLVQDNVTITVPHNGRGDRRIRLLQTGGKLGVGTNSAGAVRNFAFDKVETEWTAFVDDDDTLSPHYVAWLSEESKLHPETEVFIFRMLIAHGGLTIPFFEHKNFYPAFVGISFAVRTRIVKEEGIRFLPHPGEDFIFLNQMRFLRKKIVISSHTGYYVRDLPLPVPLVEPDRVEVGRRNCTENGDGFCESADTDGALLLLCSCPEIHEGLFGPGFSVFHNLTVDQLTYLAVSGGADGHMIDDALPKIRPGRPGWRTRGSADNITEQSSQDQHQSPAAPASPTPAPNAAAAA